MSGAISAQGLVIRGSRNVFIVRVNGNGELECRIKGKVLKDAEGFYNPLAPGDRVTVAIDSGRADAGLILALEKRRSLFSRLNQKGSLPQLLAANVDMALCLTTPASPPFRPRFLDRALLQADAAGIEPVVICNKCDLGFADPDVEERLEDFRRIGCRVLRISAKTGAGLDELRGLIAGKTSVLVGQSGVGKSSLINSLLPGVNAKTGTLNEKYDRGNHTTTMSFMAELPAGPGAAGPARLIDTPGIRRFVPAGVTPSDLILHMREFAPLAGKCAYGLSCSHRSEPGCKIMEAVTAGVIHEDRYYSFLHIQDELAGKNNAD
jgi:ribosome biogenesis GTPase